VNVDAAAQRFDRHSANSLSAIDNEKPHYRRGVKSTIASKDPPMLGFGLFLLGVAANFFEYKILDTRGHFN
jgi:hypothetical protein